MRTRPGRIFGAMAAAVLVCLGTARVALAQDESSPPGRVAQLSEVEGTVSLEPAGTGSWTSAVVNRPLTLGDKLWTDRNSRAELDIGDAVIRLGGATGFSFLNLDDETAQMRVTAGTVIVHVRSLSSGEQDEIDTPNLALTLEQPGTYRVEVSDAGDTTIVKVSDGAALVTGGGQSFPVAAQQSVTFTGTSALMADYAMLGVPDALDDWSMQRDQEEQQQAAVAQQYVPPDMIGGDDLGSYGTWEDTPDWGYAWFPTVAAGWAPYSLGQWLWVSPWGWTWVDAEPWGFAPFHYGRWGYWHHRWCWVPGPRRRHPVYAPALVAWVGGRRGGRQGGASARAGGHVGWFALGPHDVYIPSYHASPAYIRGVNAANARAANPAFIARVRGGRANTVRYANSGVPGAVTAVPRRIFTSAQPVAPHRVVLPHRGSTGLRASTAAPAITPLRQSVLGVHAGRVVRPPPRAIVDRPVVARLAPPRAPISFARQQAALRANGGRPLPRGELARLRPNLPAAPVRLARPAARGRPGLELRTAPGHGGVSTGASMSARERTLHQPALPPMRTPAVAPRSDRPPWAQRRPVQRGAPTLRQRPEPSAPQQRQVPLEWRVPPRRQAAPQQQAPVQRFSAPTRQMPQKRFVPPPRRKPQPRFVPPERQVPAQRFARPRHEVPSRRFTPHSAPRPPARHAAPARAPQAHPERAAPEPHRGAAAHSR